MVNIKMVFPSAVLTCVAVSLERGASLLCPVETHLSLGRVSPQGVIFSATMLCLIIVLAFTRTVDALLFGIRATPLYFFAALSAGTRNRLVSQSARLRAIGGFVCTGGNDAELRATVQTRFRYLLHSSQAVAFTAAIVQAAFIKKILGYFDGCFAIVAYSSDALILAVMPMNISALNTVLRVKAPERLTASAGTLDLFVVQWFRGGHSRASTFQT
jgi:hypothetical protein